MTIRPTRVNGGPCFERSSLHARRVETLTPMYSAASLSLTYWFRAVALCDGTGSRETTNSAILAANAASCNAGNAWRSVPNSSVIAFPSDSRTEFMRFSNWRSSPCNCANSSRARSILRNAVGMSIPFLVHLGCRASVASTCSIPICSRYRRASELGSKLVQRRGRKDHRIE